MNKIYIALPINTSIQDFRQLVLSDHEFDGLLQSFLADLDEDARCAAICQDFDDREDGRYFMESEVYEREIYELT